MRERHGAAGSPGVRHDRPGARKARHGPSTHPRRLGARQWAPLGCLPRRYLPLGVALAAALLVASACNVDVGVDIDVNESGSGIVAVGVSLDRAAADVLGDAAAGMELQDLALAGWEVSGPAREADNLLWLRATKHFGSPEELPGILAEIAGPEVFKGFQLQSRSEFAEQTWEVAGGVDAAAGLAEMIDTVALNEGLAQRIREEIGDFGRDVPLQGLTIGLNIDLPGQLVSGGSNYGWDSPTADSSLPPVEVRMTSRTTDGTAITLRLVGLAAAALFVLSVVLNLLAAWYIRRHRKRRAAELMAMADSRQPPVFTDREAGVGAAGVGAAGAGRAEAGEMAGMGDAWVGGEPAWDPAEVPDRAEDESAGAGVGGGAADDALGDDWDDWDDWNGPGEKPQEGLAQDAGSTGDEGGGSPKSWLESLEAGGPPADDEPGETADGAEAAGGEDGAVGTEAVESAVGTEAVESAVGAEAAEVSDDAEGTVAAPEPGAVDPEDDATTPGEPETGDAEDDAPVPRLEAPQAVETDEPAPSDTQDVEAIEVAESAPAVQTATPETPGTAGTAHATKPEAPEPAGPETLKPKPEADEPADPETLKPKPKPDEPAGPETVKPKAKADEPADPETPKPKAKADEPADPETPKPKAKADEPADPETLKPKPKPEAEADADAEASEDTAAEAPAATHLEAAVTAAAPPPESRSLKLVVIGGWGVLFQPADPAGELLIPFVQQAGATAPTAEIREAYRLATLGRLTPQQLWEACGLTGQPTWTHGPYTGRMSVSPGAAEFVRALLRNGIGVACVTNDVSGWSARLRTWTGFEAVAPWVASSDIGLRKPDPGVLEMLRRTSRVPFANCLIIDNDVATLNAARSLGMSTVLFGTQPDPPGTGVAHPTATGFKDLMRRS